MTPANARRFTPAERVGDTRGALPRAPGSTELGDSGPHQSDGWKREESPAFLGHLPFQKRKRRSHPEHGVVLPARDHRWTQCHLHLPAGATQAPPSGLPLELKLQPVEFFQGNYLFKVVGAPLAAPAFSHERISSGGRKHINTCTAPRLSSVSCL